jgi:hypothetical protein
MPAARAAGGRDNGEPGLRQDYGANYYAAFAVDPELSARSLLQPRGIERVLIKQATIRRLLAATTKDSIDL